MSKLTMRDRKEVILERLNQLEDNIAKEKEASFNPEKKKEEVRKVEVTKKAEKIVGLNILSQDIIDEYNAVKEDIENKKAELKNIYDIEVTANTLAALIEANDIEKNEAIKEKEIIVAEKVKKIEELEADFSKRKEKLIEEYNTLMADKKVERQREEEVYKYEMKRSRDKENDLWEDDKAKREAELAAKEKELQIKLADVDDLNVQLSDLKETVYSIPEQIEQAKAQGAAEKEAEMKRIAAIKEASFKKEVDLDKKLLQNELDNAKALIAKSDEEILKLNTKLEKAYEQINELATKTVQASQPIYKMNENSK